jgi:hypothetical protein
MADGTRAMNMVGMEPNPLLNLQTFGQSIWLEVIRQLEDEGVEKFVQPYDALMKSIEKKRG